MQRPTIKQSTTQKRGTVLVLFALIVVGLFAVMALMVDLGLATLTQRQMQTASDATALEILRDRDHTRLNATNSGPAFTRDRRRRQFNTPFADAPFVPQVGTEVIPGQTSGPGAYVHHAAGGGSLQAGSTIVETGWSAPGLRLNYRYDEDAEINDPLNRKNGDVVSGTWVGDGVAGLGGNPRWMETADYERLDFLPAEPDDAPFGRAVLVRLRKTRTNFDPAALALDNEPYVSTTGRTLPLLFGRGTSIQGTGSPTEEFSIRHRGLAVRATTITNSAPVVRVGVAQPGMPNGWDIGLIPVAFFEGVLLSSNPLWWELDENGNQYMDLARDEYDHYVFGESGEWLTGVLIQNAQTVVGTSITINTEPTPGWADPIYWARGEGYAPIYRTVFVGGVRRLVIGFLRLKVGVATDSAGNPILDPNTGEPMMRVTKLRNMTSPGRPWMAYRNASTVYGGAQPTLTPQLWDWVLGQLNSLDGAIHAPSIVR
jgi:Putative Flp pilus-assembly TadE/G-like